MLVNAALPQSPTEIETMTVIESTITLGELVAQRPALAALFEHLGLDYCCGGGQTLAEACARAGLDPQTLARAIQALDDRPADAPAEIEDVDWRTAPLGDLCDHIVCAHHDRLRRELPQIDELMHSVIRVHGPSHPELRRLPPAFARLRAELESHIAEEEQLLFPACRALDTSGTPAIDGTLLAAHERDHHEVGDMLATMRRLTGGYTRDQALCRTHRRLLDSLGALERDLHQHIHEENNILFPRVRVALARPKAVR